jgi:transcriptional regulator with XRE-family HTH domain
MCSFAQISYMSFARNEGYFRAFAAHLKKMRERKGLTREELGRRIGMDFKSIGRIENREGNITISTLYALSKALGVSPMDLLDFDYVDEDEE